MEILMATMTVFVITLLFWTVNKVLLFKICPICAGVSGTWFLITAMILWGYLSDETYRLIVALLMGGTVVGIAYQGEKEFKWAQGRIFKFRVPMILIGFIAAFWALMHMSWVLLAVEAVILASVTYIYFVIPQSARIGTGPKDQNRQDENVHEIEEKLKDCC